LLKASSLLYSDYVAKYDTIEHMTSLILDIDAMAEHDARLSLRDLADHSTRLLDRLPTSCAQIGKLDPLEIRHVHVVEEVEIEPRHERQSAEQVRAFQMLIE
jgi:hypothetical protein